MNLLWPFRKWRQPSTENSLNAVTQNLSDLKLESEESKTKIEKKTTDALKKLAESNAQSLGPRKTVQVAENHFARVPKDVSQKIFGYLGNDLGKLSTVCKTWKTEIQDPFFIHRYSLLPVRAIGKKKLEKFFGEIDKTVPPIPQTLLEAWESECPVYPGTGKKVKDTHVLVYKSAKMNGKPHTINAFAELITNPDGSKGYRYLNKQVRDSLGNKSDEKGEWLLMTKDVIPGSLGKNLLEQQELVNSLSEKAKAKYLIPTGLEAATCVYVAYKVLGERLFSDQSWTNTICQEPDGSVSVVGSFTKSGFQIDSLYCMAANYGVAALRKA